MLVFKNSFLGSFILYKFKFWNSAIPYYTNTTKTFHISCFLLCDGQSKHFTCTTLIYFFLPSEVWKILLSLFYRRRKWGTEVTCSSTHNQWVAELELVNQGSLWIHILSHLASPQHSAQWQILTNARDFFGKETNILRTSCLLQALINSSVITEQDLDAILFPSTDKTYRT